MNETNRRLVRLNEMFGGFWAVDPAYVNIEDVCRVQDGKGAIVRVTGNPRDHITYFFHNGIEADCIAGWASEDA